MEIDYHDREISYTVKRRREPIPFINGTCDGCEENTVLAVFDNSRGDHPAIGLCCVCIHDLAREMSLLPKGSL
jgi:hypothetical protein